MAASVDTAPPSLGLAKEPIFVTITTDEIDSADFATIEFRISGDGPAGGTSFTIEWSDFAISYSIVAVADEDDEIASKGAETLSEYANYFQEELLKNPTLSEYWYITRVSDASYEAVVLTHKTLEQVIPSVTEDMDDVAVVTSFSNSPYLQVNLSCVLKVVKVVSGKEEKLVMLNAPYNAYDALCTFDISKAFDLSPHLPDAYSIASFGHGEATNSIQEYYIRYADKYGAPATIKPMVKAGPYLALFAGKTADSRNTFSPFLAGQLVCHNYTNTHPAILEINKEVGKNQPDWVYIVMEKDVANALVRVNLHLSDGTTDYHAVPSLSPFALTDNKQYWFAAGYDQLGIDNYAFDDGVVAWKYTWELIDTDDSNAVLASVTFHVDNLCHPWNQYLLFDNGLGGMETIRIKGKVQQEYEGESQQFQRVKWNDYSVDEGQFDEYDFKGRQIWEAQTGHYDETYINHLRQLLLGQAWLIDTSTNMFYKVLIDKRTIETVKTDQQLFAFQFRFRMAGYDTAYNNF
jgi:hypothetical protein